jgi:hypothetical protein
MAIEITEQELLEMELHAEKEVFNRKTMVQKVPGGWIYWRRTSTANASNNSISCSLAGVFVPAPQGSHQKPSENAQKPQQERIPLLRPTAE